MTLLRLIRGRFHILVLGLGLFLPLVGCGNVSMLSREQEIALGEQHAPRFLAEGGGEVRDATVNEYVASIGRKLVDALPPEHNRKMPWEFRVLDSAVINAFALPGGKVFISRGLLAKLENEAELAGVLGHEIGHVTAQHIGKQMTQQMVIKTGLSILTSATESQWIEVLGGTGGNLFLLKYGRGQETQSDTLGMFYMSRAGYDPAGMLGLIGVLMEASKGGGQIEMLSTHPHPESRLANAKKLLATRYVATQNNPSFQLHPLPFQQNVLQRLQRLPPPTDTAKKKAA